MDPVFVGERDAFRRKDLRRDFARGVPDPFLLDFAFGRTLLDLLRFGSRDALSFSISAKIRAFLSSSLVFTFAAASAAFLALIFSAFAWATFSCSACNSFASAASSGSSSLGSVQFSVPE